MFNMMEVADYHDKAIAGMTADSQMRNVITKAASGDIDFGDAVQFDDATLDEGTVKKLAAGGKVIGIAKYNLLVSDVVHAKKNATQADFMNPFAGNAKYRQGDAVNIVRQGTVYVKLSGTVKAGDPVSAVVSGTNPTTYTTGGDIVVANAVFAEAGVADDLVKIVINNP